MLCAAFARDFMNIQVFGHINVGLIFGLLQFVSTFLIALLYARYADRKIDPLADKLRDKIEGGTAMSHRLHRRRDRSGTPRRRRRPTSDTGHQTLTIALFALFVAATLGITIWASRQNQHGRRLLRRRPLVHRHAERLGHRRRLHVGGLVPRHRRH